MTVLYIFLLMVLFIGLLLPILKSIFLFITGFFSSLVSIDIVNRPYNEKTIWLLMQGLFHKDYIASRKIITKKYAEKVLELFNQSKTTGLTYNETITIKGRGQVYALPFNIALYNILVVRPELLSKIEDIVIKRQDYVIYDFAQLTKYIKFSRRKFLVAIKDRKIRDEFVKLFVNDEEIGKLASLL